MESTYCTVAEVNTYAAANGELHCSNLDSQSIPDGVNTEIAYSANAIQIRCIVQACRDIVRHHQQRWADGALWLPDDDQLKKANIIQAIYLARVLPMRDSADTIGALTGGAYSDGILSIDGVSGPSLCLDARDLVDVALRDNADAVIKPIGRYVGR